MFICYTAPLGDISRRHGINVHLYADDTQIYIAFSPLSEEYTIQEVKHIQACVAKIQEWVGINKLKFNAAKTEIIVMYAPHSKNKLSMPHIELANTVVLISTVAKNIGVFFDDALSTNNQPRAAYFYLYCKYSRFSWPENHQIMVYTFVTSRLDNGNCLSEECKMLLPGP